MSTRVCDIDGCGKPHKARGFCDMHLARLNRHGDPSLGVSRAGNGYVTTGGYVQIGRKGHPLARGPKGDVYLHRAVLFDSIGEGPHGCHWCGVLVAWEPTEHVERLVVDHVNGNKLDNGRENLVPACQPCNAFRRFSAVRPIGVLL